MESPEKLLNFSIRYRQSYFFWRRSRPATLVSSSGVAPETAASATTACASICSNDGRTSKKQKNQKKISTITQITSKKYIQRNHYLQAKGKL